MDIKIYGDDVNLLIHHYLKENGEPKCLLIDI